MPANYYVVVRLYDTKSHVEIGMGACTTTGTRSDLKYAAGIAAAQIHTKETAAGNHGRVDAAPTDLTIAAQPDHTRRVPATAGPTGHPIMTAEDQMHEVVDFLESWGASLERGW